MPWNVFTGSGAEADRLADRARERGGADAVLTGQPYRVAVVRRRAPPLGR